MIVISTIFFIIQLAAVLPFLLKLLERDFSASQQFFHHESAAILSREIVPLLEAKAPFVEIERLVFQFWRTHPLNKVLLLDAQGNVLVQFFGEGLVEEKVLSLDPIERFLRREPLPIFMPIPSDRWNYPPRSFSVQDFILDGKRFFILVILQAKPVESYSIPSLRTLLTSGLGLALGVFIFGSVVLAVVLTYAVGSPLQSLAASARNFAAGNLNQRAEVGGTSEVRDLAENFNLMAEEIRSNIDKLKQEDLLRRELVGGLSHDLSTPASIIINATEYLFAHGRSLSEEERENTIASLARNAQSVRILTEDLVQLAKLGSTSIRLSPAEIEVCELLNDIYSSFKQNAELRDITFQLSPPEPETYVRADPVLLERVINNLISNALRHTPSGGKVRLAGSRFTDTSGRTLVEFEIADSGSGIAPEEIQNIFDKFYQGSGSLKGLSGLGLSICKKILQAHGSEISAKSTLGEGAVFSFCLPLLEGAESINA
jgi:signal transduction histidine kinase